MRSFATSFALLAGLSLARTEGPATLVQQQWQDILSDYGYNYEEFEVDTDDGWSLTLFHILAKEGTTTDKSTLLFQHGNMMDASYWMAYQDQSSQSGDPMFFQLVDQGYDVWMGNNRGTWFSSNQDYPYADNPLSSAQYLEQNVLKYDFDFTEMGVSDLPAMIDKVVEVSQNDKITYVGFSMGTSQMFYGLTQKEESYFASKVEKAIMMAPCVFTTTLGLDNYKQVYPVYREHNINVINDPNWVYDLQALCDDHSSAEACAAGRQYSGTQASVKSLERYEQMAISGRYQ